MSDLFLKATEVAIKNAQSRINLMTVQSVTTSTSEEKLRDLRFVKRLNFAISLQDDADRNFILTGWASAMHHWGCQSSDYADELYFLSNPFIWEIRSDSALPALEAIREQLQDRITPIIKRRKIILTLQLMAGERL